MIFDSSLDALKITDASTGEYLDVNPEFLLASGFSRAEVVGVTTDALGLWADRSKRQIFDACSRKPVKSATCRPTSAPRMAASALPHLGCARGHRRKALLPANYPRHL